MSERPQDVLLLAHSLLDYLPQARQSSSLLSTTPGLSASREVPCGVCKGRGRMATPVLPCASCPPRLGPKAPPPAFDVRHGCLPCLGCDGTGWRRKRKGDREFDAYAGEELGSKPSAPPKRRYEELQDLERRLAHTTLLLTLWEAPEQVEEAWEEQRKQMWRQGDYERLVNALERLRGLAPNRFRMFWRVHVLDEDVRLSERSDLQLERTVKAVAHLMGERPIRVPTYLRLESANAVAKTSLWRGRTAAHGRARADRDERIRSMRTGGFDGTVWKIARIARHEAMTERRVKQILQVAPVASSA